MAMRRFSKPAGPVKLLQPTCRVESLLGEPPLSIRAVELAKLEHKPDVTVGFAWIDVADAGISPVTNGRDAFLLTTGVNLPIYKKRLRSSVRAAQAKAVATAREV